MSQRNRPTTGWKAFAGNLGAACKGVPINAPTEPESNRFSTHVTVNPQSEIIDVYSVGLRECEPFEIHLRLMGKEGAKVEIKGLVDDGAMVAAMDTKLFEKLQKTLEGVQPSSKQLRMANGTIIPSKAHWEGTVDVGEVKAKGEFEVFDSGGSWDFLFSKPLLRAFKALHDYEWDTITVKGQNKESLVEQINAQREAEEQRTEDKHTCHKEENFTEADGSLEEYDDDEDFAIEGDQTKSIASETLEETTENVFQTGSSAETNIFTRNVGERGAFRKERVDAIMKMVKIGDDLTLEQRKRVEELLRSHADCFALSVSEVQTVEGAVHRLNVPENAVFSKKVNQRPLTPPQKEYLNSKIDEMLEAGIIEPCHPDQVKCVSPTTLAQKAHESGGLTLEELQHKVNDECAAAGLEPYFNLPPKPRETQSTSTEKPSKPPKWRICQNFAELNKVTEIAPMPQGDIRMKQLSISGHRWLILFDFASGFYAVKVAEESRPYTAFYVEGHGHFWYKRMPFGLTGAPSGFAYMTGTHLYDMVADGSIELFVDDGGAGVDDFEEGMQLLTRLLNRVRERNLSLSPAKSEFFVTEGIFAGAKVGPQGVTSDPEL